MGQGSVPMNADARSCECEFWIRHRDCPELTRFELRNHGQCGHKGDELTGRRQGVGQFQRVCRHKHLWTEPAFPNGALEELPKTEAKIGKGERLFAVVS